MKLSKTKLLALVLCSFFLQSQTNAQEKSKNILIADCVAGVMVNNKINNRDSSKVSSISKQAFQKYSPKVLSLMEQVESKCTSIDNYCVRNAIKNNSDYEIAARLYGNFAFARTQPEQMIIIGESACGKLN